MFVGQSGDLPAAFIDLPPDIATSTSILIYALLRRGHRPAARGDRLCRSVSRFGRPCRTDRQTTANPPDVPILNLDNFKQASTQQDDLCHLSSHLGSLPDRTRRSPRCRPSALQPHRFVSSFLLFDV